MRVIYQRQLFYQETTTENFSRWDQQVTWHIHPWSHHSDTSSEACLQIPLLKVYSLKFHVALLQIHFLGLRWPNRKDTTVLKLVIAPLLDAYYVLGMKQLLTRYNILLWVNRVLLRRWQSYITKLRMILLMASNNYRWLIHFLRWMKELWIAWMNSVWYLFLHYDSLLLQLRLSNFILLWMNCTYNNS